MRPQRPWSRPDRYAPGPWRVDPDPRPDMEWNNHIYAADDMAVCFMAHSDGKDGARDRANANLVAAAPQLLDALLDVLDRIGALSKPNELLTLMELEDANRIWAAIEKARGT